MEGHTKDTIMSVNNLVSYLIGWNELVLKWLDQDAKGKDIEFPEVGYKWNELGALARKFYEDYSAYSFEENRNRFAAVKDQLVSETSKRTDEELYGSPWHGKWSKGRMIQFNSSSPYENAKGRIRKWTCHGLASGFWEHYCLEGEELWQMDTEPPRVCRRVVGSNVRQLFQRRSRLGKSSPLLLVA